MKVQHITSWIGSAMKLNSPKGYKISKEERLFLSISVAGMRTPSNTEIEQKINISEECCRSYH